jgi:hypothetical protein
MQSGGPAESQEETNNGAMKLICLVSNAYDLHVFFFRQIVHLCPYNLKKRWLS